MVEFGYRDELLLQRRVPKRGFNNLFKIEYQLVNVSSIDKLTDSEVTPEVMLKNGLIDKVSSLIKILGNGDIKKSVKIYADAYSSSAMEKVKKAGGEIIEREFPVKDEKKK